MPVEPRRQPDAGKTLFFEAGGGRRPPDGDRPVLYSHAAIIADNAITAVPSCATKMPDNRSCGLPGFWPGSARAGCVSDAEGVHRENNLARVRLMG